MYIQNVYTFFLLCGIIFFEVIKMFVKENKNKTINIRVTEEQKKALEQLAIKKGYKNISSMTMKLWEKEFNNK